MRRFRNTRKRQSKSARKKRSVNVSRNFFSVLLNLGIHLWNLFFEIFFLFSFWNINELEQEEKKEKSKCKCREGMSGIDVQRELDTKRESVSIRD